MIALCLLLYSYGTQAQNSDARLDQLALMKQFLGSWKGELGKDTAIFGENTPFGTGMVCESRIVSRGKVLDSIKQLFGYDNKNDKFIMAELIKSSQSIEVCASWFTTNNAGEMVLYQDISNPKNAALKWKFEFKSPDSIVQTALKNNKMFKAVTITRVKK
jgi:hypothetical protein